MHTNLTQLKADIKARLETISNDFTVNLIKLEHTGRIIVSNKNYPESQFEISIYQTLDKNLLLSITLTNSQDLKLINAVNLVLDRYKFEIRVF